MTPPDRTIMLREQIADALAYNDECGPGLVSRGEYLADADAIIAIVCEALLSDEAISRAARALYELDMVACGLSTELVSTTQTDRERLTDGGWWHKAEVMLAAASSEERP